jgi:hypothetical protein
MRFGPAVWVTAKIVTAATITIHRKMLAEEV